jgi:hypothetical protein
VVLSQGPSGTDSGSALQVRSDRSLLSGKGQAPITARSPDIASLIRATLARSRWLWSQVVRFKEQREFNPSGRRFDVAAMLGGLIINSAARCQARRSWMWLGCRRMNDRASASVATVVPSFNTMGRLSLAAQPRSVAWRSIAFPLTHCLGFRPERVAHLIRR